MTVAPSADSPFTASDSPALRAAVERDLARVTALLQGWAPGAAITLGGSFAWGEATAWMQGQRLLSMSDYDLFMSLPHPGHLARLGALRARLGALRPHLYNPRLDLNLQLPGLASRGWQASAAPLALAGDLGGLAPTSSPLVFCLHALHGAQVGLLACAPGGSRGWLEERYQLNRCALRALRAAWNLEAPRPVHHLLQCREPLRGPWGQGLDRPLRDLLEQALDENPGLGLAGAGPSAAEDHGHRWALACRLVNMLHERWARQASLAGPGVSRQLRRERAKGAARLAWGGLRQGRAPRVSSHAHGALLEARRALLEARLLGGIDGAWLQRGLRGLHDLGLGPRRWPAQPRAAWEIAWRCSVLPNPGRIVSRP